MIANDKNKHLSLLKLIEQLKSKKGGGDHVSVLLDRLDDTSIDEICECMYNILHTDLNLPTAKKTQLKKLIKQHCPIHHLTKVTKKSVPVSNRRKHLKQIGGGLPMILATAIPFLVDLLFGKK